MMTFWGHPRTFDRYNPLTGEPRIRARTACLVLVLGVALVIGGSLAEASQSPAGCSANGVALDLIKSAAGTVTNGETVTYTVNLGNGGGASCDASNIVIKGFCPDASGNPTILNKTFPTISSLPNPTTGFTVGTFDCVVSLNDGLSTATARDSLTGLLHDNTLVDDQMSISKDLSVNVALTPPPPPPPPPPDTIPTLSEWVMIMLAAFLVLVGVVALRRKRIA
jgi:uncharacterized repeat protein (TIGR01451 family)